MIEALVSERALRTKPEGTAFEDDAVAAKSDSEWYSVRCVFKFQKHLGGTKRHLYEERITIWKAISIEDAIGQAEREATAYAESTGCEYTGLAQAFQLYVAKLSSGGEVFSLMRESNFNVEKYLDRFFDTGDERQGYCE